MTATKYFLALIAAGAVTACDSDRDAAETPASAAQVGDGQEVKVTQGTAVGAVADDPAATSGQTVSEPAATGASLEVSRTREGNGGILAVAGEMTMEFDYSPPQGHCRASDGTFVARGIGINDDKAGVSIEYATIVAPDTGTVVGQVFNLEVTKDGYVPWAANSALAGTVEDTSQDTLPGGGVTLTVTGNISGLHENRAPTGTRKPFRLEATCEPQTNR